MKRPFLGLAIAVLLCLSVSFAHGQARGKGGEKSGASKGKPSAGKPSEGKPGAGKPGAGKPGAGKPGAGKPGAGKPPGGNWSEPKHSGGSNKESGGQGAATGAAAANHNAPKSTGAEGAAAGAAASNRNSPKASGAEGAAAGAAASNRNSPKASGAEGAAAGAAAANRNAPKASGAEGAAAGAAVANRNAPKASGAEGAVAGAAAANRNSPQAAGAAGAAVGYAAVRNSFDRPDLYGQNWHGDHPGAWTATGWAAGAAWTPTAWGAVASHCAYGNVAPVSYNYGTNVTCVDGNVIHDEQNIGTAEEFSQQAADLAQAGTDAKISDADKWLPLGVFALVRNDQQHPHLILQMAVNQTGAVRGNYTDEVTDNTLPIHGGVDQKTQRLAWTVGGNTSSVMEAGLSNLTDGEAPALLHKNGKTERWYLVRLPQPE